MIKSINTDQQEIIKDILALHCDNRDVDVDITYSLGKFYKKGKIKEPTYKFDKYPQTADTVKIEDKIPLPDNSQNVIVCDLPFVISKGPSLESKEAGRNMTHERFSSYPNLQTLQDSYKLWIAESYRVLKKDGILIFKCQDQISGGKQILTHVFSINEAEKVGFYTKDLFVLIAKSRLMSGKWKVQRHARKFHSFFLIFKK